MSTKSNKSKGQRPKPKAKQQRPQRRELNQRAIILRESARVLPNFNSRMQGTRQCERDYYRAALDPLNYTGDFPCALGYETNQTFRVCKKVRAQVTVGAGGVGFIGMNPYLAGASDAPFCWYSSSGGYTSTNADSTVAGVTAATGSGAFATSAQMQRAETYPDSISYRVVAAGMRLTPTAPVFSISGACYCWQNSQSDAFIGATAVSQTEIVSDFNKPVTVLNGDQRQLYYTWTPPAFHSGDWVSPATYAAAAAGMTDLILVAGANAGTTFLAEIVVFGEYKSYQFSTQATPSHSNKAVASEVSAAIAKKPVRVESQAGPTLGEKIANGVVSVVSNIGSHAVDLFITKMGDKIGMKGTTNHLLAIEGPRPSRGRVEELD